MNCPLCDTELDKMADEYYFICQNCNAYVKDKKFYLSHQEEKKVYQYHNNDVEDLRYQKFTSPITNEILSNHQKEQLGLDYGCGTGPVISKQLMEKNYQLKLFDPYFFPDQDYLNHQYDYIFSCEVFEHFYHPKQEIEKLWRLLKPNGKLYIMTQLFDPSIDFKNWHYRKDPTHVFIYTQKTIDFIAKQHLFGIEKLSNRLTVVKKLLIQKS